LNHTCCWEALPSRDRQPVARHDAHIPFGELAAEAGIVEGAALRKPGRSSGPGAVGMASWCSTPLWIGLERGRLC
jgi:hypothetical protein